MKLKQPIIAILAAAMMTAAVTPVNAAADGWTKTDKGYVYEYDNGDTAKKGFLKVDGKYYYIQKDGTRKTGWLKTTSGKYYFGNDGVMYRSRWLKLKSGKKYYLKSDGKAAEGLLKINGVTYKFDSDGLFKGQNYHFICNTSTLCLHSTECWAAEKIKDENYSEVDIGAEEFEKWSADGHWACGVEDCNSLIVMDAFPKKK